MGAKKISPEEAERALVYYKSQIDALGGENLKKEYEISGLRKDVTQRRRAFTVLSGLVKVLGTSTDIPTIFQTTITDVSATLGMDRVFILGPTERESYFRTSHWVGRDGLDEATLKTIEEASLAFPPEFCSAVESYILANSSTPATELTTAVKEWLGLPFFASVPILVEGKCIGIMIMGRLKEAGALFPPIDQGDVETLQAVVGLISAVIQNMRVGALQETDRLKTEFFSNISHEFRTPITLTLGPLEGLFTGRYGLLPEDARAEVERMIRSQRRLLTLVNQILDLAKFESGGMKLKVQKVRDINRFVRKRIEQFLPLAEKRGIGLPFVFEPSLEGAELYVDLEKFDHVVFNLLSNAYKFTKRGQVKTTTSIENDRFVLRVEDTGIGIRQDQLISIFDRFKQADGSESREYAGTGIGLSLVKQVVEIHGGTIQVSSEYGKGSTFNVSIPLGTQHLPDGVIIETDLEDESTQAEGQAVSQMAMDTTREGRASPEELKAVEVYNQQTLSGANGNLPLVLYVDDNRDLREFVSKLLIGDFRVILGVNGQHGLELAKANPVDLILSDLMMPVMNGTQFLRAAKEDHRLSSVPFVILTARSSVASKVGELEGGADDYLSKPFSEPELIARVKNLIKIRDQQTRIKRDLQAAKQIQLSLMPKRETKYGTTKIETLYHPCEELSGDFFDIQFNAPWVYFFIADVTSHGTASAQVTYLLKGIFQELLRTEHHHPTTAQLIADMARRYVSYQLEYAVELQVGRLHVDTLQLDYSASGAPSPTLVSEGKITSLDLDTAPYIFAGHYDPESSEFGTVSLQGKAGDMLYFVTDGSFEFTIPNTRKQYGPKKLNQLFAQAHGNHWREDVFKALSIANGGPQFSDDLTILRISF